MQPIIIKSRNVRVQEGQPGRAAAKRVELLSDGGIVHAIQVCCGCGERTVLELEYEPTAPEVDDED